MSSNKLIYICLKDGQTVKLDTVPMTTVPLDSTATLNSSGEEEMSLSKYEDDQDDDYSNDSDSFSLISSSTGNGCQQSAQNGADGQLRIKRKRQRLTHLSQEEKMLRRKVRNQYIQLI
jgi:hypothetical protein